MSARWQERRVLLDPGAMATSGSAIARRRTRVVVTGVGLVSTLGDRAGDLHAALCRGEHGLRPVDGMPAVELRGRHAGQLADFAPARYLSGRNLRPLDRTARLAATAAELALDDAGWRRDEVEDEVEDEDHVGLVLGTLFGSVGTISGFDRRALEAGPSYAKPLDFANSVINAASGQTAIWHRLRGVNSTIAGGISAGVAAIAYASDLIATGRARALLAGGAEELCFESYLAFDRAGLLSASRNGTPGRCVPFDRRRDGFALAEGAALLMLEDERAARRRGATVLGEVLGHASGFDPSRGRDPERAAAAIARVLAQALDDAGVRQQDLDVVFASANGSPQADRAEARGLAMFFGPRAASLPVTSTKGALGESLGAGGAFQAAVLLEAMRSGVLPGIRGLDEAEAAADLGLGGLRANSRELALRRGAIDAIALDGAITSLVLAGPANGPPEVAP